MIKQRDVSIDIVKFLAVFLIINSHADIMYAKFPSLATGGAIGDALFLFCSGYTLFWKEPKRFDNWYKKRISRIYPSVFACITISLLFGYQQIKDLNILKYFWGGEFVAAIMIYYVPLYFIQKYGMDKFKWIIVCLVIVTLVAYYFFPYKYETSSKGLYGNITLFRWIPYFAFMLMGAWLGLKVKNGTVTVKTKWADLIGLLLCLIVFYGIQFLAKKNSLIAPWQIVTLPFLVGIVYYFWKCCNADFFKNIYSNNLGHRVIMLIGGLCLESYLIQFYLFTDKLNWLFPLNLFIITAYILVVAYLCRCLARMFIQTFRTEDYQWKKVFEI